MGKPVRSIRTRAAIMAGILVLVSWDLPLRAEWLAIEQSHPESMG